MSDYTELVKALRQCVTKGDLITICDGCPYKAEIGVDCENGLHKDAAAAIEELQAEVEKWQDVAYQDSLAQMKQQERIWELESLRSGVGQWIVFTKYGADRDNPVHECTCSNCKKEFGCVSIPRYCPNCGTRNYTLEEIQKRVKPEPPQEVQDDTD